MLEQMTKRLNAQPSFEAAVWGILDDAIALQGAEFGTLQLRAGTRLLLVAQRGFRSPFLSVFREVGADDGSTCGRTLRENATVIVEDVDIDEAYARFREVARQAGYRSVATTPLASPRGRVAGAVSTHFANVHVPTPIEIDTLRKYSMVAADRLFVTLRGGSIEARAAAMNRDLYEALPT